MSENRAPVTVKQLARTLGLSHSTVSRSLSDSPRISAETKRRVREAADQLGYVVHGAARQLRGAPSSLFGLVLPDVRPDFFSAMTAAFAEASARRGFSLLLSVSQHDPLIEEAQIRALREARVSGVLIFPTIGLTRISRVLLTNVPTVQIGNRHGDFDAPFVGTDDRSSMATLVAHLSELGHTRIGYLGPDPRVTPGAERLAAFTASLRKLGLPVDDGLIETGVSAPAVGGEGAARLLAREPRPTALIVGSALLAEGTLDVIQTMRIRLPQDLSFASFGDPFWHRSWGPGITSVAMRVEQIVDVVLGRLLDPPPADRALPEIWIPTEVMLRGTTGRPGRPR